MPHDPPCTDHAGPAPVPVPGPAPDGPAPPAKPGRPRCTRCERPLAACLCGWIRPTPNALPVLLLQHPLEARQAKGSARLLALSLAHCRLVVGEVFEPAALAGWLAALGPAPVLLYPPTPALPPGGPAPARPTGLVLIDATWRKSLRLLHLNPALTALPRRALAAPPPSRYHTLRRAPQAHQRATLEACCLALGQIEPAGPGRYQALLAAFDGFVAARAAFDPSRD